MLLQRGYERGAALLEVVREEIMAKEPLLGCWGPAVFFQEIVELLCCLLGLAPKTQ